MKKLLIIALLLVPAALTSCSSSDENGGATVINRFCLPGGDGNMWEHVDLSDGRQGVPTGAIC
ncbi:unannotated protein [freshwater metagenome]|uniref:Unannotated protein n=1 Tax=freshwater metagenome TaxID=449393 RepID=A0A6J6KVC8_9ZZZZ|nr:hypothetical protein [Actinomycetota bacterium]